MIRKVYSGEIDRSNLSKFKTYEIKKKTPFDYRGIVVQKPWGYEYLMFENSDVAIWILHLRKGYENSVHCHPRKKTSMLVLSGKVRATTLTDWFDLSALDGLIYDAGLFHTQKALTDDVFLMEIETPPDKHDLVRLKDSYGREGKTYEDKKHHSQDIKKFKYVYFSPEDIRKGNKKKIRRSVITLERCRENFLEKEIVGKYNLQEQNVYSIIEDKVVDPDHRVLFWPGAIFQREHLINKENIRLHDNCLLLTVSQHRYT